eukprot:scaffold45427_cov54-Phaeocystis_antarctica.AAC.1
MPGSVTPSRRDGRQSERCHQPVEQLAFYQVSEAVSALGVTVGDGSRRHCAECVCVERHRLQRLQQPERRRCHLLRRRLLRRHFLHRCPLRRCLLRYRLQEVDDLRALLLLGPVQRRPATLRWEGGRAEVEAAAPGGKGGGALPPPLPSLPPTPLARAAAHVVLGIHVGALGDEVLEAVELAVVSRRYEGREAVLRRRGGGAIRGERRRRHTR